MSKCRYGRHAPSFILLFLAEEPSYGSGLLNKIAEKLPHNRMDSAAVYRALQDLEEAGAVKSSWDTSEPGPAKKWYKITEQGFKRLAELKADVEQARSNLDYFLKTYEELGIEKKGVQK